MHDSLMGAASEVWMPEQIGCVFSVLQGEEFFMSKLQSPNKRRKNYEGILDVLAGSWVKNSHINRKIFIQPYVPVPR